jgi:hypothetical protein
MSDQYASSDLILYLSSSVMVEVCCIFMIMLLGNLLGYLLWNRHLHYLLVVMIYIRNLIWKMSNISTIQKPYCRQFPGLTMAGLADALKPEKFTGIHFKRWQVKTTLWLTTMNVFHVSKGKPEGGLTPEEEKKYDQTNTIFTGAVLSVLVDRLVDANMQHTDGKELWDAVTTKYGASDAGSDLYIMESSHDYKMADNRSIVEQAHEIQCIAKELDHLKIVLPDRFVAGCIITKLPSTWRNFATSLKHKRQEISVENLIASLDVEEKARAKDTGSKGGEGHSSANMVQMNHNNGKGKTKSNKPNKTTNFKKKKNKVELTCCACGETGHFAKDCPDRADRDGKKGNVNIVVASNEGDKGYGNLPFIFSVFQSPSWWLDTGANVHVCSQWRSSVKITPRATLQI